MTPGSWQASSACGTWLWCSCCRRRGPNRCGAGMGACCWHTDWRGQGRSIHPELPHPACLEVITWPSGRTFWTSDHWGRMKLYGPCNTGSWGALDCRGGHLPRLYRSLWPRRGNLRRWASISPKILVILSKRRVSCNCSEYQICVSLSIQMPDLLSRNLAGSLAASCLCKLSTGQPLFTEIPGYSFNESGQLQPRAMSGSEPKLLVSHQSAFIYYMRDPS